ncbi:phosphatidylserine decarboxylase [Candidatus Dependentiae bacterium]
MLSCFAGSKESKTDFVIIPVGALMVGKILYEDDIFSGKIHKKGDPFGWFKFGGSTVCCVFRKSALEPHPGLLKHSTGKGGTPALETAVKMGEKIGVLKRHV